MTATLRVLGKRDCPLCDEMLAELQPLIAGYDLRIDYVDVGADQQLLQRYGSRIPVLEAEGVAICEARLDAELVSELLNRISRAT